MCLSTDMLGVYISVDNSHKALNYRLFKKAISFENFVEILKDKLCHFRPSKHRLPIGIGGKI